MILKKQYLLRIKEILFIGIFILFPKNIFAQIIDKKFLLDSLQSYYNHRPALGANEKEISFPFYLLNDSVKPFLSVIEESPLYSLNGSVQNDVKNCNDSSFRVRFIKNFAELYPNFITKTKDNNILIPSGYIEPSSPTLKKAQLLKCSSDGKILWQISSSLNSKGNVYFYRAFEANDGSIYVTGNYEITDLSGGLLYTSLLIAKFKADGTEIWHKTLASPVWSSSFYKGTVEIRDIAEDQVGDIYFTGSFTLPGSTKALLLKLNNNGNILWSKAFNESNNVCLGYGINFINSASVFLIGQYPSTLSPIIFTAVIDINTGSLISSKAWKTKGNDSTYSAFAQAYVTRLNNGNLTLFGKLFNDGFYFNGRTKYAGMIQFNSNLDFVNGWQLTGDYISNNTDTKLFVHPDSSADFTFNNLIPGKIDSINLFVGNVQQNNIVKQRVIKQKQITPFSFNNFCKMDDGGSDAIVQHFDNKANYHLYFLHNSDPESLYFGNDSNVAKIETLLYKNVAPSSLSEFSNVLSEEISNPLLFIQDTIRTLVEDITTSSCSKIALSVDNAAACTGASVTISAIKNAGCFQKILWTFDTSAIKSYSFLNDSTLAIVFAKSWKGFVYASTCLSVVDSVFIEAFLSPGPVSLGQDQTLCPGSNILLNARKGYKNYTWQDGSSDSLFKVSSPGIYTVNVTDSCGNTFSDAIQINPVSAITFALGKDTAKCNGDTIVLKVQKGFFNYNWQSAYNLIAVNDSTVKVFPQVDTSYWVSAQTGDGCFFYDTIKVAVNYSPIIDLGKNISSCAGDSVLLDAGNGFANYLWSNGSALQQIKIFSSGIYSVVATAINTCVSSDSVNIIFNPLPIPTLGNDTSLCKDQYLVLNPGKFTTYLWQDGTAEPTFNAKLLGTYNVKVWDNNNCANEDTINILGINPSPGNLLADTASFCQGDAITLFTDSIYTRYFWNTGNIDSTITIKNEGLYWLQVVNSFGCSKKDSINVSYRFCTTAVYFPTGFSPNGDGRNDFFKPKVYGIMDKYFLVIYNRFGQKIFESTDAARGWDGRDKSLPASSGNTYVWYCSYQLNGEITQNQKGTITVIR